MVTFEEQDYEKWKAFRMVKKSVITHEELKLVSDLHSRYYKHKYYVPCTCSPKEIKRWIKDLNKIWDNGNYQNS